VNHRFILFDLADKFSGPPTGNREQMWGLGVVLAAFPTGYGLYCCLTGHAKTFNISIAQIAPFGRSLLLDVAGGAAIALGLAFVFLGLFLHFHWFWCHHRILFRYYEIGKVVSLIGLAVSIGCHIYLAMR
jgi:hypothetical protein